MKQEDSNIAKRIRTSIETIDPKAQVIIFGSPGQEERLKMNLIGIF